MLLNTAMASYSMAATMMTSTGDIILKHQQPMQPQKPIKGYTDQGVVHEYSAWEHPGWGRTQSRPARCKRPHIARQYLWPHWPNRKRQAVESLKLDDLVREKMSNRLQAFGKLPQLLVAGVVAAGGGIRCLGDTPEPRCPAVTAKHCQGVRSESNDSYGLHNQTIVS
jgi:hypothetical protein